MLGQFVEVLANRRDESQQSVEQTVNYFRLSIESFLSTAPPEQVAAFKAVNRAIAVMDLGLAEDSAEPPLSARLKDLLFAIGFDTAKFKSILRAICDSELHVVAGLFIWILEQFASIVAQVDDALIPEHVARMIVRLEQENIDFDDLSLGEQITARFLLGRKLDRPTPWETGIPLNGIFVGFRLTDVEVVDQHDKNTVRFTIVGSSGRQIQGMIPLLGLDAFNRLIQRMAEKQVAIYVAEQKRLPTKMTLAPNSEVPGRRFRVAFTFSGTKRDFISQVAKILAARFGEDRILYDKFHEAEFARRDLGFHLPDLYHDHSDLIVVVICPDNEKKEWCGLEWDATFDLLKQRKDEAVMLCRFEHATVKGLYSTAGFVELDDKTPDEAAILVLQRLAKNEGQPRDHYVTGVPVHPGATTRTRKSLRLVSTRESVDRGEITLLAIVETLLAMALLIGLSVCVDSVKWLSVACVLAPLLLLRTVDSVQRGLRMRESGFCAHFLRL